MAKPLRLISIFVRRKPRRAPSADFPLPTSRLFRSALSESRSAPSRGSLRKATSRPPGSEVARLEDRLPLPPPRPPGLGEPARPATAPVAEPAAPAAPVDDENFFRKLFGSGCRRRRGMQAASGTPPRCSFAGAALQSPGSEIARLGDGAPLPPPRPPGLGGRLRPPRRRWAQPAAPAAPVDDRNFFRKLFGLGLPPRRERGHALVPRSPPSRRRSPRRRRGALAAASSSRRRCADAAGRGTGSGWFSFGAPQRASGLRSTDRRL